MEIEYYIDKSRTIRKAVIVYQVKGSVHSPVLYIHKPKWRTESEFNDFIDKLELRIKL